MAITISIATPSVCLTILKMFILKREDKKKIVTKGYNPRRCTNHDSDIAVMKSESLHHKETMKKLDERLEKIEQAIENKFNMILKAIMDEGR